MRECVNSLLSSLLSIAHSNLILWGFLRRNNGLYGPGAYVIANSLVNIPFLFLCAVLFSVIWCVDAWEHIYL